MTLVECLQALVAALPSDTASVTLSRADLTVLLGDGEPVSATADMSVEQVAQEVGRAASTVRGWLISGALRGYKLNNRDWRVTRSALRAYLDGQGAPSKQVAGEVDISAWRTTWRPRRGFESGPTHPGTPADGERPSDGYSTAAGAPPSG